MCVSSRQCVLLGAFGIPPEGDSTRMCVSSRQCVLLGAFGCFWVLLGAFVCFWLCAFGWVLLAGIVHSMLCDVLDVDDL